jgi:Domain of unknown function (DUF1707)
VAYGPGQAYSPQPALPGEAGLPDAGPANMGPPTAMVNPSWLAATADRERTVGVIRAGFAEGRLTQDELDERVAAAYAARTYAELWALTADLPAGPLPVAAFSPFPQGTVASTDGAAATSWHSAAALLITALVIFTLAALVTAIVTAHAGQPVVFTPYQQPGIVAPFQHVDLTPYITSRVKA